MNSGECLKTLKGHSGSVLRILALSNKRILSGSFDKKIKLWYCESGECLKTFDVHFDVVTGIVKFSNEKICSCSNDGSIKIWNLNTGECKMTLKQEGSGEINDLKILDNNKIISGTVYDLL